MLPLIASGGFHVLPVHLPAISAPVDARRCASRRSAGATVDNAAETQATTTFPHYLFLKKNTMARRDHTADDEGDEDTATHLPAERTLFVLNTPMVPCGAVASDGALLFAFRHLFRKCGAVERVVVRREGRPLVVDGDEGDDGDSSSAMSTLVQPGCFVYVVFRESTAIAQVLAMKAGKRREWAVPAASTAASALQRWSRRAAARVVGDRVAYQAEVDAALAEFDEEERRQQSAREQGHGEADEEGWVTVTRRANRRNATTASSTGTTVLAAKPADVARLQRTHEAKEKKKLVVDFYRFQLRQQKCDKLAELRKKFDEDRVKIARLNAQRKFKPY